MGSARLQAAWCLYDAASSAFNTIILTFVFATYVVKAVAPDPVTGTAAWGQMMAMAGIVVAILSPFIGAMVDAGWQARRFLGIGTAVLSVATALLFWVRPEADHLPPALWLVALAVVAFELTQMSYSALLPKLTGAEKIGRLSGYGWASGYAGGLLCLALALLLVKGGGAFLDAGAQEPVRATALLAAGWIAVFSIPLLRQMPAAAPVNILPALRQAVTRLKNDIVAVRTQPVLARFLVLSAFWRDGLNTLFLFGGIFAATEFGFSTEQILFFGIGLNVTAGAGAALLARLDDQMGPRWVIAVSLIGLMVFGAAVLLTHAVLWFWVFALLLGIFVGPLQAASRSLLVRLVPEGAATGWFGFYGLTGRAAAFLGPAAYSAAVAITGEARAGMATILLFFAIGLAGLYWIKSPPQPS